GPEMKSTGEVMGIDWTFGQSFCKASMAAGSALPGSGVALMSIMDTDKPLAMEVGKRLIGLGFSVIATAGTALALEKAGLKVDMINKVGEGKPDCVDRISEGAVDMVINTTSGKKSIRDSFTIRRTALTMNVPYFTTIQAAKAAVIAIESSAEKEMEVLSLQEYFETAPD
ncbi:Carbamoyl-phosphate synthase large chain, partial [hydrothermal vent metagenome]